MTEETNDFARTNYILNRLRQALKLGHEKYVKWYYGGSFNGAGLVNKEQNEFAAIFFYKDKVQSYYGDFEPIKIDNIWIIVDSQISLDLKSMIANANDEFEILSKQNSKISNQVKRLFIEINFSESSLKETVETFIDNLKREFSKCELSRFYEIFPPLDLEDAVMPRLFSFDVEIILDSEITEEELIERLRKFIPQIKKSVYGFGFLSQHDDIQDFPIHLHLYARQF